MTHKGSAEITFASNPSSSEVEALLKQSTQAELRGIEDHNGTVYLWPYEEATHMIAAAILGIPYDAATDYVTSLTGKTFYIRSLEDWLNRERRRSEPDSFTSKCRNADQND
jgi:hypothetical protein